MDSKYNVICSSKGKTISGAVIKSKLDCYSKWWVTEDGCLDQAVRKRSIPLITNYCLHHIIFFYASLYLQLAKFPEPLAYRSKKRDDLVQNLSILNSTVLQIRYIKISVLQQCSSWELEIQRRTSSRWAIAYTGWRLKRDAQMEAINQGATNIHFSQK